MKLGLVVKNESHSFKIKRAMAIFVHEGGAKSKNSKILKSQNLAQNAISNHYIWYIWYIALAFLKIYLGLYLALTMATIISSTRKKQVSQNFVLCNHQIDINIPNFSLICKPLGGRTMSQD